MNQIIGLNVIRGIAAILVLLYHYTCRYNDVVYVTPHRDWSFIIQYGGRAVTVFFMISGYLTVLTMDRNQSSALFIKKRINRLYPTFWVAMLITFSITKLFGMGDVGIVDLLGNITMLPNLVGVVPVDGVYWTQQCEIIFYVIFCMMLILSKNKYKIFVLFVWIVISLMTFLIQNDINTYVAKILRVFCMTDFSSTFIVGLLLGFYKKNLLSRKFCSVGLILSFLSFYLWHDICYLLFFVVCFIILLYFVVTPDSVFNRENYITKPIIWVASLSYPLYLVHQKIGYIIISKIIDMTGYDSEIIICVPIIISVFIAWILHTSIESNKKIKIFNTRKS